MNYFQLISELGKVFEEENIPYQYVKSTSLWIQGVNIDHSNIVFVEVQWDLFEKVYALLNQYSLTEINTNYTSAHFYAHIGELTVFIQCFFNTTIRTNPYRVQVMKDGNLLWCKSLYQYLFETEHHSYNDLIRQFLNKEQERITHQNEGAWNQHNYDALLNRHGNPDVVAGKVKQNPSWRLHPFYKYFNNLEGKKVIHLMGSNGIKGVALSLLGAEVTIVDFSSENKAYALELASSAGVSMNYIVSDILSLPIEEHKNQYDFVLMELGVLHYFIDLLPLMDIIFQLINTGGIFILHEFHPVSTKLITSLGKKHKVTGNYFDPSISKRDVAFTKHIPNEVREELEPVLQREWTLGELVTSVAQAGMKIQVLEEEPNHKIHDIGLPKTFTLVSTK